MTNRRLFYLDLLERTVWTFVQGYLAAWIVVTGDLFSMANLKVGLAGGALAVAKGILATQVGSSRSAATLPSPPDYAAPPVPNDPDNPTATTYQSDH